jgi:hypothetical protein
MLVYLDQNYWGRLLLAENASLLAVLSEMADNAKAIFPVSAIHILETMKAPPARRHPVFALMAVLSGGWCLRNPISAMRLELQRHRQDLDLTWIKACLLTKNPIEMLGPDSFVLKAVSALIARCVGLKLFLDLLNNVSGTRATTAGVNAVLSRGAHGLNGLQGRIRVEQAGLAVMLGVSKDILPSTENGLMRMFPSLQVRTSVSRAIFDARSAGVERNDVTDLGFLAATLPYFDVVTVDRRMGARIKEASAGWPFSCEVVSDIAALGDVLKSKVAS